MRALAILLCAASAVAAEGPCVGSGSPAMSDGRIVISEPTTRIQWREQAGFRADNSALTLHWLSGPSGARTPHWTCGRMLEG